MNVEKFISPFIESQFPQFYQEEGPAFIEFMKAYYEWMEQPGNPVHESRSLLEYRDLDSTLQAYVKYFKDKYIDSLPENIVADKKLLIKHILDLYRSKGTDRSYKLLFRLLFNEDIDIYIPGKYMFKLSSGTWVVPKYIEVSDHPNLADLVGKQIYSSSTVSTAVVENYFVKTVNGKLVNVLTLTGLNGRFKYGERVLSEAVPQITADNAPIIFGSLSSVSVVNGGLGFKIGDILRVKNSGVGGLARVIATRQKNGEVTFDLVNGGTGFSVNAVITVDSTNTGGTGATFAVGSIVNKEVYHINTDVISDYYAEIIDSEVAGYNIEVSSVNGTFTPGDTVHMANVDILPLDVTILSGTTLAKGENLSNSALGIADLTVILSDDSFIELKGSDINNANLVPTVILVSNTTGTSLSVNTKFPIYTQTCNATIVAVNSSVISVNNQSDGFFVFGEKLFDGSANAVMGRISRLTNWEFPKASVPDIENMDTEIGNALTTVDKEVGTIASLKDINPGEGYASDPTVTIIEPLIYQLSIHEPDGSIKGFNAVVTAKAGSANGIATAVEIIDAGYGYDRDQMLELEMDGTSFSITGTSVVDLNGVSKGYWRDNQSFLSDQIYLQGGSYRQSFSYEIIASRMLNTYENYVKDLVHPVGMKLFGRYLIKSEVCSEESTLVESSFT